jgi:hypothetical protein
MTEIESCSSPHRRSGKCCTSEGGKHSFTSEGGKHNSTTNLSPAKHIITLNTKFSSQTKTPARRAVTPQTPHVVVRRSSGQQHNLSQDMIAETISQANQCFSISTKSRNQKLNNTEQQ